MRGGGVAPRQRAIGRPPSSSLPPYLQDFYHIGELDDALTYALLAGP